MLFLIFHINSNMKYKLLKELPDLPVWTIIIETDDKYFFENWAEVNRDYYDIFYRIFHRDTKEYYEKINEEKKTIHEKSGTCFMINRYWNVDSTNFDDGVHFLCISNRFLTREEAEDEHKRREWAVRPDKFIPKIWEDYFYPTQRGYPEAWKNDWTAWDALVINSWLAFRTREECEKAIKEHDLVRLFYTIR